MFPIGPTKFGRENDARTNSDTPVTQLSRIFSKTSFNEFSDRCQTGNPKLNRISEGIPFDLDESANQEAPDRSTWLQGTSTASHLNTESSLNCEVSNSSSGYYSCPTQSAPPTCDSVYSADLTDSALLIHRRFSERRAIELEANTYDNVSTLRRTQSCRNRDWLAKRHRKQPWPRISGIFKPRTGPSPQIHDSNSCPAAISNEALMKQSSMRASLPPLGESGSSQEDSPPRENLFTAFTSPEHRPLRRSPDSFLDSSIKPVAKRQRMDSCFPDPVKFTDEAVTECTLPLDETENDKVEDNGDGRSELPFEILRHQSTPVLSARAAQLPGGGHSPMYQTGAHMDMKPLLRCASVPVQSISEKLNHCMSVLDNPNFRCDGRRPRALPVIQRMDSGLHCVSIDTVAELVTNPEEHRNLNYLIVDCRFPYEYDGGHIQGAVNIYTHSDLLQEIFNRVPAQRPPGIPGPPKLLGERLARKLAMPLKEPLSAPCEPISDEDDDDEYDEDKDQFTSEASELELAAAVNSHGTNGDELECSQTRQRVPSGQSEANTSVLSFGSNNSGPISNEPSFVVIFHCEFSSQRAPDLAAFLRSVDRVSNYHRYPFLYFPEIYVMKGGYSAFYQNYPHLCDPNSYVKMSHRDYRPHFRLYRRLTKRVSSACTSCIRPQHKLFNPPMVDSLNSFGHVSISGARGSHSLQEVADGRQNSPQSLHDLAESDKENKPAVLGNDSCTSSPKSEAGPSNERRHSISSDAIMSDTSSVDDGPLLLAETVVRVGQRVIAATLSTAGTSLGIDHLLNKFNEQVCEPVVDAAVKPVSLKRAETVGIMYNMMARRRVKPRISHQAPLCSLLKDPFCMDEGSGGTPSAPVTKKRTVCTPLNRMHSAPSTDNVPTTPLRGSDHFSPYIEFEGVRLNRSLSFSPTQNSD